MIKVENVKKSFEDQVVLKGINLEICDNEIFGIIGKSGAGKSTLLDLIIGIESCDEGSISIDGHDLSQLNFDQKRKIRKNLSMVFQNSSLMSSQNVYNNIALPMKIWGYNRAEIRDRVSELSKKVGIEDKLTYRIEELSGGQKQRVSIARALALEPKYIFFDESTSALDPQTTDKILDLYYKIWQDLGITLVIVTHEMEVIQKVCHRMAIISRGEIATVGDVKSIFMDKNPELMKFLGRNKSRAIETKRSIQAKVKAHSEDMKQFNEMLNRLERFEILDVQTYDFNDGEFWIFTIQMNHSDKKKLHAILEENNILFDEVSK